MKRLLLVVFALNLIFLFAGCQSKKESSREKTVVVYVSEDQVFSEPVLRAFHEKTGIKVKAVYDTEEAKSTGVMNRIISERSNPQADVYWANEPIRAEVLRLKGLLAAYKSPNAKTIPQEFKDPDGYWTGFSARARVLIVNKKEKERPQSIMDFLEPRWKGKAVIANPLFGTTTSHIAALFIVLGERGAKDFLKGIKENQVAISTSNGESADFVAKGEYAFSLVDSDDAISRMKKGLPVEMIYPDQKDKGLGCFIVPNAVMLIKGAPHPEEGKRLIDYLLSKEVEKRLAFSDCEQIPLHKGVEIPQDIVPIENLKVMKVDYKLVAKKMIEIQPLLKKWMGL